ncbi:MAG: hypothetical protein JXQ65_05490 [Candidatus Marinimicrobia bacterium]|nr:hypothetical protein [Candidatus Neomarinimicrobiota bacterium]
MKIGFLDIFLFLIIFLHCYGPNQTDYTYPDTIAEPDVIAESHGCGNIYVYQPIDSLRLLTVFLDGRNLELTERCHNINLCQDNPNVRVVLEVAGNSPDSIYFHHCDDAVPMNLGKPKKYASISGSLSYSVSENYPIIDRVWKSSYYVTIKIENLQLFNHEENLPIVFDQIIFWNVRVGWLPG